MPIDYLLTRAIRRGRLILSTDRLTGREGKAVKVINQAKVSRQLLADVKSIAGGMYQMNARYATVYAFNAKTDGKSISTGEFMGNGESLAEYDYSLSLTTGILQRNS